MTEGAAGKEFERIVHAVRKGESEASRELFELSVSGARQLAYSLVGPKHCEDVLQESYLLVFQKIHQLREASRFRSWLYRLVLHVAYRYRKKEPGWDEIGSEVVDGAQTEDILNTIELQEALAKLKQEDREILILREVASFSYDELAHLLRVPKGTVRSRLHKARVRLSNVLKRSSQTEAPVAVTRCQADQEL